MNWIIILCLLEKNPALSFDDLQQLRISISWPKSAVVWRAWLWLLLPSKAVFLRRSPRSSSVSWIQCHAIGNKSARLFATCCGTIVQVTDDDEVAVAPLAKQSSFSLEITEIQLCNKSTRLFATCLWNYCQVKDEEAVFLFPSEAVFFLRRSPGSSSVSCHAIGNKSTRLFATCLWNYWQEAVAPLAKRSSFLDHHDSAVFLGFKLVPLATSPDYSQMLCSSCRLASSFWPSPSKNIVVKVKWLVG